MKEKWVRINTIEGYEDVKDCYWISNADEDRIMNKNTGKILKIRPDRYGYLRVNLITKNGGKRDCYLHILKARAFIFGPNPLGANIVRHLNDVKCDNRLENLAWGTLSDNTKDSMRNGSYDKSLAKGVMIAKRSSKPVRCLETGAIFESINEAEHQMAIDKRNISKCCRGKRKTAGKYHWEFIEILGR